MLSTLFRMIVISLVVSLIVEVVAFKETLNSISLSWLVLSRLCLSSSTKYTYYHHMMRWLIDSTPTTYPFALSSNRTYPPPISLKVWKFHSFHTYVWRNHYLLGSFDLLLKSMYINLFLVPNYFCVL